jgi:ribosomal protein L37E
MSFYKSNEFHLLTFRDCSHCEKSISSDFSYCPHCGFSQIEQTPNYRDILGKKHPFSDFPPLKDHSIPKWGKIDLKEEVIPKEYCSHCGQLIIRSKPLEDTLNAAEWGKRLSTNRDYLNNDRSSSGSSCFIATACNADAKTLNTFYNFRDEILLCSPVGKRLVQFYYRFSPSIAELIQKSEMLQSSILSVLLKPLAALLRLTLLHPK